MDRCFDGEHKAVVKISGRKRAHAEVDGDAGFADPALQRQRSYLCRTSTSDKNSYRPVPMYRTSAKRWLMNVDTQLIHSFNTSGLQFFQYDSKLLAWRGSEWRTWPYASFSMDHGPDGICGYNSLENKWYLNVALEGEVAHGCNCDFDGALIHRKMKSFWLCMLMKWNLVFGPGRDQNSGERYHELSECLDKLYKTRCPDNTPLFQDRLVGLVECLKRNGHQLNNGDGLDLQVWAMLADRPFNLKEGFKANCNRFCGTIHVAMKKVPYWEIDEFEVTYLALEQGMLSTATAFKKLTLKVGAADTAAEGGAPTGGALTCEDKMSMSACHNAVVHSVVMMDNGNNYRICQNIIEISKCLPPFYADASKNCRSADGCEKWSIDMAAEGVFRHLEGIMGVSADLGALERCNFLVDPSLLKNMPAEETITEDDFADHFGMFQLELLALRGRRLLYFMGWPHRMKACPKSPAIAEVVMNEFKLDKAIDHEMRSAEPAYAFHKTLNHRSQFKRVAVVQFVHATTEFNDQYHADIDKVVRRQARLGKQSVVSEEALGTMKNKKRNMAARKFKKPAFSMHAVLSSKMLSSRFHYDETPYDVPLASKLETLPASAFRASKKVCTLPFSELVSTSQKTEHWSPGSVSLNVPIADLYMKRDAKELNNNFEGCRHAWLGELLGASHKMLFRYDGFHPDGTWYLGLMHFDASAAWCWPGKLVSVADSTQSFFEPEPTMDQFHFVTVFDLDEKAQACALVFRSWAWQVRNLPPAFAQASKPAIRLFVEEGPSNPLAISAGQAFWDLKMSFLKKILDYKGWLLPPDCNGNLCKTLLFTITKSRNCSETDAADKLSKRLRLNDQTAVFMHDLLNLDEALDVLDVKDAQVFEQNQKDAENELHAMSNFYKDFVALRREMHDKAAPKKKAKAKEKPRIAIPNHIDQPEAKKYLPPDASIWRGRVKRTWNAHVVGRARISEPWGADEQRALATILQRSWAQWLDLKGKVWAECPWDFADVAAAAAAASSSA